MSKTLYRGHIAATVEDSDNLPDGMTQDDVWDSLLTVLRSAAAQWYSTNSGLVRTEPDVF